MTSTPWHVIAAPPRPPIERQGARIKPPCLRQWHPVLTWSGWIKCVWYIRTGTGNSNSSSQSTAPPTTASALQSSTASYAQPPRLPLRRQNARRSHAAVAPLRERETDCRSFPILPEAALTGACFGSSRLLRSPSSASVARRCSSSVASRLSADTAPLPAASPRHSSGTRADYQRAYPVHRHIRHVSVSRRISLRDEQASKTVNIRKYASTIQLARGLGFASAPQMTTRVTPPCATGTSASLSAIIDSATAIMVNTTLV